MKSDLETHLQCRSDGGWILHDSCVPNFATVLEGAAGGPGAEQLGARRAHPLLGSAPVTAGRPSPRFVPPLLLSNGAVIVMLLLELATVIIRALVDSVWSSTIYTLYLLITLFSWCACAATMALEHYLFRSVSETWVAFWYGALALPVEFLMFLRWIVAVKGVLDRWELGLLGLYGLRYISISSFSSLSVIWLARNGFALPTFTYRAILEDEESGRGPVATPKKSFLQQFKKVVPYMWARDNLKLQMYVAMAFGLLVVGRVVGPLTPLQYKVIVDSLSSTKPDPAARVTFTIWRAVIVYGLLRLLQGGNGLISSAQSWVLIPINQVSRKTRSLKLSLPRERCRLTCSPTFTNFHIKRKTGEILRVMDRGTSSVVSLMNYVVFSVFPTIADIVIAVGLLCYLFDGTYSLIVLVAMGLYLWATISITEWRTQFRREMNEYSNKVNGIAVDSLLNFETVKYFGAESFEVARYDNAMREYLRADLKNSASLPILNLVQNFILTLAIIVGSLLCSYEVTKGTKTVGDFIYFNTYLLQISIPLNFFGTIYRMIQQNFIDMEKMLELLEVHQSVSDLCAASSLNPAGGEVVFNRVCFSYSGDTPTLNELSFTIPSGKAVALVGPSGGGKSTILKLLFRFYDVESGTISVDGQDISKVTQASLRRAIGVVPQDTVLFNDTIRYNIGYGNPSASDWEVENAAKLAQIHDRILSFPQGYDTIVGERGLRLSGGEKQRVAIARTFLKDPKVVLLDEATSALDTATERQIQESFNLITRDRTTLVIAHRLSTVVSADLILCIKDGKVVEKGSHAELLTRKGLYSEMWEKQLQE
ncbi:ATP-binding cassette-type vacuolar membrane transporter Hmt1 [Massospora cicadina]|nr:ATP-binding cassette-type vacuolar membrane transporter Hmt1 [Massospora cicadina]